MQVPNESQQVSTDPGNFPAATYREIDLPGVELITVNNEIIMLTFSNARAFH